MNILIVKLSSLGDVVQTIPVVHDILHHHPQAQIDWVVEEAFAPLVAQVAGVCRVIPIAQRRWRKVSDSSQVKAEKVAFDAALRQQAYDCVLDVQGLIKSGWVMWKARMAKGGIRATFGNRSDECSFEWPVKLMANKWVAMPRRVHAVERYRRLAAGVFGYEIDAPAQYGLRFEKQSPQPAVLFAHGTTRDDNLWPLAQWASVGQRLIAQGLQAWIPHAGEREATFAQELATQLGQQARVLPAMGLPELWHTMSQTAGVIGVDSGVSHMAVALGLPHVQIFSQDRAWRAGPVGCTHQVSVGGAQAPDVDAVWQAWQTVWAAKAGVAQ